MHEIPFEGLNHCSCPVLLLRGLFCQSLGRFTAGGFSDHDDHAGGTGSRLLFHVSLLRIFLPKFGQVVVAG